MGGEGREDKVGKGRGHAWDRGESRKSVRTLLGSGLEQEWGGRAIFVWQLVPGWK